MSLSLLSISWQTICYANPRQPVFNPGVVRRRYFCGLVNLVVMLLAAADPILANLCSGAVFVGSTAPGAVPKPANLPLTLVTVRVSAAGLGFGRVGLISQPETGQRHASQADAEFLQRRAPRDRLSHALGEFVEFVVHVFSFRFWFVYSSVLCRENDRVTDGSHLLIRWKKMAVTLS
jgi:hypothetical protein